MKRIVFATNNAHKLEEIRVILGTRYEVLGLKDIGCEEDIPETADTLEGNALIKARYIKDNYGYDCFADDTGLEVDVLNGAPGVYSARYAGNDCNSEKNMVLLLENMHNAKNRAARFRTVICFASDKGNEFMDGSIEGEITLAPSGKSGFGYDPIFKPDGYEVTFAEMSNDEKNSISHRKRAVDKLLKYLE